jgi:hypothetical protein
MPCPSCAGEIPAEHRFCPSCGAFAWTVPAPEPSPPDRPGRPPEPTAAEGDARGSAGLRLELRPDVVTVTPGEVAVTTLTVVNTGTRVESFEVAVVGPPWLRVEPPLVSVYPGQSATVAVEARPPRVSTVPAGVVGFQLVVTSRLYPDVTAAAGGRVDVAGFAAFRAELTPASTRGRGTTAHRLAVANRGNRPLRLDVGVHGEPGLDVHAPRHLELQPGEKVDCDVSVTGERVWFGRPGTRVFTLETDSGDGAPPHRLTATRTVLPWLPPWAPVAAVALAAVALAVPAQLRDQPAVGLTTAGTTVGTPGPTASGGPATVFPPKAPAATPTATSTAPAVVPGATERPRKASREERPRPTRTAPTTAPSVIPTRPVLVLVTVTALDGSGMTVGVPQGWDHFPVLVREGVTYVATDPGNPGPELWFGNQPFRGGSLLDRLRREHPTADVTSVAFGAGEQAVDVEYRTDEFGRQRHLRERRWVLGSIEYHVILTSDEPDWDATEWMFDSVVDSATPR